MDLKSAILDAAKDRSAAKEIIIPGVEEAAYATPLTIGDLNKIKVQTENSGLDTETDTNVFMIINKLQDKDGKQIFTIQDRNEIKSMDWKLLSSILEQLNDMGEIEEAEKP